MKLCAVTVLAVLRTSTAHREVAQSCRSGIEMAVIHEIAGRIDRAGLDLETCPFFTLAPHHCETFSLSDGNNGARAVAMKQAATSCRKLLNMAAVGRSRQ